MNVKAVLCAGILLLAVLIGGCTTVSPESGGAVASSPSLLGNWNGTVNGYTEGMGYSAFSGDTMTMKVTEQRGRIFSGKIVLANQRGVWKDVSCAGVIGRDGRTLSLVEGGGGHSSGVLVAPGEIEFIYSYGAEPFTIAINSLKKV
jgi:hypothetical protein